MHQRSISIDIAGHSLKLRTDASDEDVEQVRQLVEERVALVRESHPTASSAAAHLLAALTLAEDLRAAKAAHEDVRRAVVGRARAAMDQLERDDPTG